MLMYVSMLDCWGGSDIAKHLSLPPVKLHCSMLAEDAVKAAVKDYQAKRAKREENDKNKGNGFPNHQVQTVGIIVYSLYHNLQTFHSNYRSFVPSYELKA